MRRFCLALALAAAGTLCLTASASAWPPTSEYSWSVQELAGVRGVAVAPSGHVFVLNGARLEKYGANGSYVKHVITGSSGVFQFADDLVVDSQGIVYVADTYGSRIQLFDSNLEPLGQWTDALDYPRTIELGPGGDLYILTQTGIQIRSPGGQILESWGVEGATAIGVDPQGDVVVTGWGLFRTYRSNGKLMQTTGGRTEFGDVQDLVVEDSAMFLHTGERGILAFDSNGIFRGDFWRSYQPVALTRNSQGRLVAVDTQGKVTRFGPVGPLPPAPPPPPAASSAVILHIGEAGAIDTACEDGPTHINQVVTQETADRSGNTHYFVYLLAMPRSASEGILGVQCGIQIGNQGGQNPNLRIDEWTLCADYEVPQDTWPTSETGNTITWVSCDFRPLAVAGYFLVTPYGPSSLSVVPYPQHPHVVKTANCNGAEQVVFQELGPERVGWVSMGGGAIGLDRDGCNPAMEPCAAITVPVEKTTWGKIKTLYGSGK